MRPIILLAFTLLTPGFARDSGGDRHPVEPSTRVLHQTERPATGPQRLEGGELAGDERLREANARP